MTQGPAGIARPGLRERILVDFGLGGCVPLFTQGQSEFAHFLAANPPSPSLSTQATPPRSPLVPITSPASLAVLGKFVTPQVPPPAPAPGECVLTSCCVRAGAESLLQLSGAGGVSYQRAEAGRATLVLLPLAAHFAHISFLHGGYYFSLSFSGCYGGSLQE